MTAANTSSSAARRRRRQRNRNRQPPQQPQAKLPAVPMPRRAWFNLDGATSDVTASLASLVYQSRDQCPYHHHSLERALIHFDDFFVCGAHLVTEAAIRQNHASMDCDACNGNLRQVARYNQQIGQQGKKPTLCEQHKFIERFWN